MMRQEIKRMSCQTKSNLKHQTGSHEHRSHYGHVVSNVNILHNTRAEGSGHNTLRTKLEIRGTK